MPPTIDPFATPEQRCDVYLQRASAARTIAERSSFPSIRQRYYTLALLWTALANDAIHREAATGD
jgi:hypothetical protein